MASGNIDRRVSFSGAKLLGALSSGLPGAGPCSLHSAYVLPERCAPGAFLALTVFPEASKLDGEFLRS